MSEIPKPNVLREEYSSTNVSYYDNRMPVQPENGVTQYLVVNGERHEISELNEADWLILNALYPHGPQELS